MSKWTWSSFASAVRFLPAFTALSALEPRRERCVWPPSHHRETWLPSPLSVGKVREHLSYTCFSFSATTYSSFVPLILVVGCIYLCMTLLFFSEINIAASLRDPAAIAVTLVVAVAASSSPRAASSAYSNLDIFMDLSPDPTVTSAVWTP